MKCNNCGNEVSENAKFCRNCGSEVVAQSVELNQKICVNCGATLKSNTAFCGKCGTPSGDSTNMTSSVSQNDKASNVGNNKKSSTGLIVLISVLIAVILVCAGTVGTVWYMNNADNDTEISETDRSSDKDKEDEDNEEDNRKDKKKSDDAEDREDEEFKEGSSEYVAEPADETFEFSYNRMNLVAYPAYAMLENSQYAFYCAIPEHFVRDDSKMVYYAPDKTAIMEIRAEENIYGKDVTTVMNEYISEIGGEVGYSASGDTWFAVSIDKDGVSYYKKGFVDHYIREFSFCFPEEYSDTYDPYIEYIEDNFRRTDV